MTLDGTWHDVSATAIFEEYCQRDQQGNPTQFWKKMCHVMTDKCAEALCIRKSFPDDVAGVYTEEEMMQAEMYVPPPAIQNPDVKLLDIEENPTIRENRIDESSVRENRTTEKKEGRQKISVSQMTEISDLLSQCSEEYRESFWNSLSTQKVTDWSDVTNELYPKIKNALYKQIEIEKKGKEKIEMEKTK
jgi:hypothetical protein